MGLRLAIELRLGGHQAGSRLWVSGLHVTGIWIHAHTLRSCTSCTFTLEGSLQIFLFSGLELEVTVFEKRREQRDASGRLQQLGSLIGGFSFRTNMPYMRKPG